MPEAAAQRASAFVVKHYAGSVTYAVANFITNNTASLVSEELLGVLAKSNNTFLRATLVGLTGVTAVNAGDAGFLPSSKTPSSLVNKQLPSTATTSLALLSTLVLTLDLCT
jgi:myosin heavy subunit